MSDNVCVSGKMERGKFFRLNQPGISRHRDVVARGRARARWFDERIDREPIIDASTTVRRRAPVLFDIGSVSLLAGCTATLVIATPEVGTSPGALVSMGVNPKKSHTGGGYQVPQNPDCRRPFRI
ncbi:MAG: hypothetical protein ABI141_10740 [Gemmatimonadaceae bacterium]